MRVVYKTNVYGKHYGGSNIIPIASPCGVFLVKKNNSIAHGCIAKGYFGSSWATDTS